MEIVAEYGEVSTRERYMMTARSAAKKGFKDVIGKVFQIKCACQTEDIINGEGDEKKIKKIFKFAFSFIYKGLRKSKN